MDGSEAIGRIGEVEFVREALSRGLNILHPDGVRSYDFVVEYDGKYTKVQVKTTMGLDENRRYRWNLSRAISYADVHAFHVLNTDVFFMMPSFEVTRLKNSFAIPLNKIDDFKINNWDIFKQTT